MRYPIKDKFWGWRMDPCEVFAYWTQGEPAPIDIVIDIDIGMIR